MYLEPSFSAWDIILRVLVCPDIIDNMIPEFVPVIPEIERSTNR